MSTLQDIKGQVDQIDPTVLMEGKMGNLAMSTLGQLFTADWHTRLVLAGRVFSMNLGSASGSLGVLTGITTVDNDLPSLSISCDTGWLIPISIDVNIHVDDLTSYDQVDDILFTADRTQAVPAGAVGNIVTAINQLEGGAAFAGRCFHTHNTTPITNPVASDILGYKFYALTQLAGEVGGNASFEKGFHKTFDVPHFLAGPCSILGYVTGSATPTYFGKVVFAHLPASWITVS